MPASKSSTKRKSRKRTSSRASVNSEVDRLDSMNRKCRELVHHGLAHESQCTTACRRHCLEQDDEAWLMHYYGEESGVEDPFTYEFTSQQREMIGSFGRAITLGGDQSIAASRGEGKSLICERTTTKYTLADDLDYTIIFQASGTLAGNSLDNIKTALAENPFLLADYPEVCYPIACLENTPQRAKTMVVSGYDRTSGNAYHTKACSFTWCGPEVILPNVPGSPAAKSIIQARGLDSAIRGVRKKGRRPRLAVIDDADTDKTASNEEQAKKLAGRIDKSIGGLGGQTRPIARIMLCTIQSVTSVAYKFTDQENKPSWHGKRFRFLLEKPERLDLWQEYVQLKQRDWRDGSAAAHGFYLEHREAMDLGAVVANPNRKEEGEISALQHFYNMVARYGEEPVDTEYNNDPPAIGDDNTEELTARRIQFRVSDLERCEVPEPATVVVRGIDVGKYGLHWVVRAFTEDASPYTIDYGYKEVHGVTVGTDDGVEHAIRKALIDLYEATTIYQKSDVEIAGGELLAGDVMPIGITLVDSRYFKDAVVSACREIGEEFMPAMGHGQSNGCVTTNFRAMTKDTDDCRPGDGWYVRRDENGDWIVHCDTDRWKAWEHARWMTDKGKPGAAYLFGKITDDELKWMSSRLPAIVKEHTSYAKHITAEAEVEEVIRGVLQKRWRTRAGRSANHYLDASYLCDVGANMRGVYLLPQLVPAQTQPQRPAVISPGRTNQSRW